MTNLEARRIGEARFRLYAQHAGERGDSYAAAYWTKAAESEAAEAAGILATGNDDFIPF